MGRHNLWVDPKVEKRIENWRAKQRPIPDFTESVDTLLQMGLARDDE